MSNNQEPGISWKEWRLVPSSSIQERLETVRTLQESELELYEISKDKVSAEHYLHYAYLHRNVAAIGTPGAQDEVFHQLLPLDSDDVLGLLFEEQPYTYPEHWQKPFLRNGPEGDYVWFDPSYAAQEAEFESIGRSIAEQLARFKEQGDLSEEAVRRFLSGVDAGFDPESDKKK
ncbi:hypothetical protein [Paenibacillus sp. tmac-D7]|uniref:hypothetical protein n=1 Tax=Paenibacillus sp. tmac-D7 TaxID=2591462 RepID=UPI00215B1F16|nr:hypothetical protein [Paenibacillus sp. tmac-D7]